MLGVKLGTFSDFLWKRREIQAWTKDPSQAYTSQTCEPELRPSEPPSSAVSLAQWLNNLLGPRHPASQAQPSAQLSSHLATRVCLSSQEAEGNYITTALTQGIVKVLNYTLWQVRDLPNITKLSLEWYIWSFFWTSNHSRSLSAIMKNRAFQNCA